MLARDAVRRADDGAWPSLDMRHHPAADRLEIARKIELGDCCGAFLCAGHNSLSGCEEGDRHHHGIAPPCACFVRRLIRGHTASRAKAVLRMNALGFLPLPAELRIWSIRAVPEADGFCPCPRYLPSKPGGVRAVDRLRLLICRHGEPIVVLDEEPVVALAAVELDRLHMRTENPTALELLASPRNEF